MKTLQQLWNILPDKSDKGDVHSYLSVYDEILSPYRTTAKSILEIGLFNGYSLKMWEHYFAGKVYGIDCSEQPHGGMADLSPLIKEGTHNIFIGDAENSNDIEKFFKDIKFDVVIEDAGHHIEQQLKIYETLKPYLSDTGLYIIEDIQDIDKTGDVFIEMGGQIIDLRKNKGRYDDCLVIFRN